MKYQELAHGVAYTIPRTNGDVTIVFPFGLAPQWLFGDTTVRIDDPERFGEWGTSEQRRKYVRTLAGR